MLRGSTPAVLKHLTTLCRSGVLGNLDDEQLLERFIELSDETSQESFATLVQRHGPMVFGVCYRVLHDIHDAEDAFQATFLVLARKATSVIPREKVANWLYGVAFRTASEARIRAARRRAREERVASRRRVQSSDLALHTELRAILDEELSCLPARYRGPIVLCELEGLTRQAAALRLGVPEGTLSSRLARGKARLRDRLARRGMAVPVGALALAAINEASAAIHSERLIESTTLAATRVAAGISAAEVVSTSVVSLTEGVLKSMLLTKLKVVAFVVLGSSVALVSGAVALGQSAPGLQTASHADGERMTAMERKLDRIIDALDRMAGTAGGLTVAQSGFARESARNVAGPETAKAAPAAAPGGAFFGRGEGTTLGPFPPRRMGTAVEERLDAVERRVQDMHGVLMELSGRVEQLEQSGRRPRQPTEAVK
jgi:RNA polymerase sigma factor (sigma-70 family)